MDFPKDYLESCKVVKARDSWLMELWLVATYTDFAKVVATVNIAFSVILAYFKML